MSEDRGQMSDDGGQNSEVAKKELKANFNACLKSIKLLKKKPAPISPVFSLGIDAVVF